jgi:hypothetical protein
MLTRIIRIALIAAAVYPAAFAAERTIPEGSKVFIAPMGGFETYVKAAIEKKKVPVTLVEQRDAADYELSGTAESQKASTAKKVIMLDWHSKEQASIKLTDIKSSEVVFAYSVHKASSAHGKQSSAEACAKHLKEVVKTAKK